MDKNLQDFLYFKRIIDESRFDNRTLTISLEDCFGIPENHINSTAEINGGIQYHVRYKDILVIMFWNEQTMAFEFPDYFGIYEGGKLVRLTYR